MISPQDLVISAQTTPRGCSLGTRLGRIGCDAEIGCDRCSASHHGTTACGDAVVRISIQCTLRFYCPCMRIGSGILDG